jgi:hypothetical protein
MRSTISAGSTSASAPYQSIGKVGRSVKMSIGGHSSTARFGECRSGCRGAAKTDGNDRADDAGRETTNSVRARERAQAADSQPKGSRNRDRSACPICVCNPTELLSFGQSER